MQHYDKFNDGYKYLLTVIDVFSKYAWVRPLRSKSGNDVASAFKDIMDGGKRSPRLVWSDKGKEFYNKNVESLVTLYSTENEEKSCVVERFNRTLKGIMFKYFTANNTYRYIDVIQEMVDLYNNTKHRSIKMTPVEASNPENESQVYLNLYDDVIHDTQEWPKPKFSVGDRVRITKKHTVFKKSYLPLWTEELFVVSERYSILIRLHIS
jgi:transposase InsO family protein